MLMGKFRFMKAFILVLAMLMYWHCPFNLPMRQMSMTHYERKFMILPLVDLRSIQRTRTSAARLPITTLAQANWDTMNKAAGRTYLWSDLETTTESEHVSGSYQRLEAMTLAYVTRGSTLQNNAALLADIISAMDWMYTNRYNTSIPYRGYDNWFDWQISSPLSINNITTWIYSSLTATQISRQ